MEREWVPASAGMREDNFCHPERPYCRPELDSGSLPFAGRTQNIVDPVSRTGRHFFRIEFELCLFSSPDSKESGLSTFFLYSLGIGRDFFWELYF